MNHFNGFCFNLAQKMRSYAHYFPVMLGTILLFVSAQQKRQLAECQHNITELQRLVSEQQRQRNLLDQSAMAQKGGMAKDVAMDVFQDVLQQLHKLKAYQGCVSGLEKKRRSIKIVGQVFSVKELLQVQAMLKSGLNHVSVIIDAVQTKNQVISFTIKILTSKNIATRDAQTISRKITND